VGSVGSLRRLGHLLTSLPWAARQGHEGLISGYTGFRDHWLINGTETWAFYRINLCAWWSDLDIWNAGYRRGCVVAHQSRGGDPHGVRYASRRWATATTLTQCRSSSTA
jgi:hypothetical protein